MLISTGNELDFHFWVRHGSTHAELEIKNSVRDTCCPKYFWFYHCDATNISTPVIG